VFVENVHFSSKSQEWRTPQWLFNSLNKRFNFTLDAAASKENALVSKYYTMEDSGLNKSWERERVFLNPPYGKDIKYWVEKAKLEADLGAVVVALLPARTDTKWWHEFVQDKAFVYFMPGRVKFEGDSTPKSGAPFPSCICVWCGLNFNSKESHVLR
jgi:site-specific DNA-methyltransferase (adenine-specific)